MIIAEAALREIHLRHPGARIVLAGGTFDLFHTGHLDYIESASKQGDILVVSIAHDEEARRRKGPTRPIIGQELRARLIDSLRAVHYTVIRSPSVTVGPSNLRTAQLLQPDVVFFASDAPEALRQLFAEQVPHISLLIDEPHPYSTTEIITCIQNGGMIK